MGAMVPLVLQFLIAVLLAFIGFTLQGLRRDTQDSLRVGQENQVAIGNILAKLDGIEQRLDRLERSHDNNERLGRIERAQHENE